MQSKTTFQPMLEVCSRFSAGMKVGGSTILTATLLTSAADFFNGPLNHMLILNDNSARALMKFFCNYTMSQRSSVSTQKHFCLASPA
jgi:hypothetical protein